MNFKRKVLIIDDEAGFTKIVKLNLEATGKYEVIVENQSNRALASAQKNEPDIILLDILMPKIDGFEVLELLKKDLPTISIPVIMLTAITADESKALASRFYNESYIEKPVTVQVLDEEIGKVLARKGKL
ncbi:MAG: response regulator [Candidatus Omnitrophica bacterium]|nr:response regulator [Candidatus Omnitrophota bacterium]